MILACIAARASLQAALPAGTDWLSDDERARAASFSLPARRQTFVAGRWLLRWLLAQLGSPAGAHSISHSGAWVAAAVSGCGPVGVDIEDRSRPRDWVALAEFAGWPEEAACADADAFLRRWTLGEAWLKARGAQLHEARWLRWQAQHDGSAWHGVDPVRQLHAAVWGAAPPRWLAWPGEPTPAWQGAGRYLESAPV